MPTDDTNFNDELRALLAAGRKIEAIKRYRAATGAGLADAKNAVESLERGQALPPKESAADSSFEDKILALMRQGQKIRAIQLYREKTGVGLKEAKDFIEALAANQHIDAASKGCLGVVVLLAFIPLAAIAQVHERTATNPDHAIQRSPASAPPFILGADISWVQQQEDEGVHFTDHGQQKDLLAILKEHGFNGIRLRVFHNPKAEKGYSKKGYCDLQHTLAMAKRIQAADMRFLLDLHYSDTWADPGHQAKPVAWAGLHGAGLEKAVRDHTRDVVAALKRQETPPEMVQIGNEISNGFLWPDGNVWKTGKWDVFCGLIKAGIAGAKEADPAVKAMLHLAWGGQNAETRLFVDKALAQGVQFDILGQSYYPKWHGTPADLRANLTDLAARYKQDLVVVDYSVPDVRQINDIVHGLPGGKGLGTFIWEPTKWEGPALFDSTGNTRPEIDVYSKMPKDYGKP